MINKLLDLARSVDPEFSTNGFMMLVHQFFKLVALLGYTKALSLRILLSSSLIFPMN